MKPRQLNPPTCPLCGLPINDDNWTEKGQFVMHASSYEYLGEEGGEYGDC